MFFNNCFDLYLTLYETTHETSFVQSSRDVYHFPKKVCLFQNSNLFLSFFLKTSIYLFKLNHSVTY